MLMKGKKRDHYMWSLSFRMKNTHYYAVKTTLRKETKQMKKPKKSLYELKKEAVDDFMKVYDKGSRDDVFMYYNEVVNTAGDLATGYGREVGKYKGSLYGLLMGLGIVGFLKVRKALKEMKEKEEETKKMKEIIARHEKEEQA